MTDSRPAATASHANTIPKKEHIAMSHAFTFRRAILAAASSVLALAMLPTAAQAQSYPNHPIKLVVPFAPGSGTDFVARILAEELTGELGATVLVENRPGASGTIGADAVAKAPADGYTLLMGGSSTHSSAPSLFKKLPYDPEKDFLPIANTVETAFLLLVRADAPQKSLADLSAWLQANQDAASFAYGSPTTQIAGSALMKRLNLRATAVPYKSSPQALTDLLGGQVAFLFIDQTIAVPQIKGGKVRALAVAADQRLPDVPDVPTMAQAGVPNFVVQSWVGILAPAGIPAEANTKLTAAIRKIMLKRNVLDRLSGAGKPVAQTSHEALLSYLKVQRAGWADKVRDAGVQPE